MRCEFDCQSVVVRLGPDSVGLEGSSRMTLSGPILSGDAWWDCGNKPEQTGTDGTDTKEKRVGLTQSDTVALGSLPSEPVFPVFRFSPSRFSRFSSEEDAAQAVLQLAAGSIDEADYSSFLRSNVVRRKK